MSFLKAALATVGVIVVAVLVLVGGYEGGWWLQSRNIHHGLQIQRQFLSQQQQIVRSSYEFTTTQINLMQQDLNYISQENVSLSADPNNTAIISEIQNLKQSFCNTYNQVQSPANVAVKVTQAAQQYQCASTPGA